MTAEEPFKPSILLYIGSFVAMADRFSVAPMLIPISVSLAYLDMVVTGPHTGFRNGLLRPDLSTMRRHRTHEAIW